MNECILLFNLLFNDFILKAILQKQNVTEIWLYAF